MNQQNTADFSQGSVGSRIMAQAIPLSLAEIVQLLYNIVDRVFLGHLPDGNTLALTGVGLIFPIVSIVAAFTSLYSSGGAPIFAMARGRKDEPRALQIQGTVYSLLLVSSLALMALCYAVKRPLLFLFGASEDSFVYADAYLKVYLLGTPFTMLATGLNPFINAQGRPKVGMMTTVLGAAMNLVLDPLFIYVFDMGVTGAAVATVISQAVSCIWVLRFLTGKNTVLRLRRSTLRIDTKLLLPAVSLGASPFVMQSTESLLTVAFNVSLQKYGGDLAVGAMTILTSVAQMIQLPLTGLAQGAQPILSYNFGAHRPDRMKQVVRCNIALAVVFAASIWGIVQLTPHAVVHLFTSDTSLTDMTVWALRIYMALGFTNAFQTGFQQSFVALGEAKISLFLALERKVFLLIPLIFILPRFFENKLFAVFLAEPVADVLAAATTTVLFLIRFRKITNEM